jgi:hypothetical protein
MPTKRRPFLGALPPTGRAVGRATSDGRQGATKREGRLTITGDASSCCCCSILFVGPRITILCASSGSVRCNILASAHGARIQTSRSSSVVRMTGIAFG